MIRAATISDAGSITSVQIEAWVAAYKHFMPEEFLRSLSVSDRSQRWEELLSQDSEQIWVYLASDSIRGFVHYRCVQNDDGEKLGEIERLYVHPQDWGAGIGLELMDYAIRELRSGGTSGVSLWVAEENPRARRFYESRGFQLGQLRRVNRFSIDGRHLPPDELPTPGAIPNSTIGEFVEIDYHLKWKSEDNNSFSERKI